MSVSPCHPVASLQELCVQSIVDRVSQRTVQDRVDTPTQLVKDKLPLSELLKKVEQVNPYLGFSDRVETNRSRYNYYMLKKEHERRGLTAYFLLAVAKKLNSYEQIDDRVITDLSRLACKTLIVGPGSPFVAPLFDKCNQLEVLCLQSCAELRNLDATSLKNLKELTLSNCPKLEKVAVKCDALLKVKLSSCPALRSVEVEEKDKSASAEMTLEHLDQLSNVDLSKARNVTEVKVRNCPNVIITAVKQPPQGIVLRPKDPNPPLGRRTERYPGRAAMMQPRRDRQS
ncbi:MAG: hypothetical protein LLG04_16055 [Parachlamydia sp.]|nr:hypothetical protein [Parachlamydia sp.]